MTCYLYIKEKVIQDRAEVTEVSNCLEHGIKVIERIFEERLRKNVKLDEMRMGFVPGKGTTDLIFSLRQMMEKYEAAGKKLVGYLVFEDLEKAFDRVPRKVIW